MRKPRGCRQAHHVGMLRWRPLGGAGAGIQQASVCERLHEGGVSSQGGAVGGARPCCTEMQMQVTSASTGDTGSSGRDAGAALQHTHIPNSFQQHSYTEVKQSWQTKAQLWTRIEMAFVARVLRNTGTPAIRGRRLTAM